MTRRTKIIILLVPVFIAVLGFIFLLPHGGYRRQLEAYKQQLIARGEKLTIAELAPPPPTNPSNRAKAFMQLMGNYKLLTNLPTAMRIVAPGLADVVCTNLNSTEMVGYDQNLTDAAKLRGILDSTSVLDFSLDYSKGANLMLPHLAKLKASALLLTGTVAQASYSKNFSETRSDLLAAANLLRLYPNEPLFMSDLVRAAMAQIAVSATWEGLQSAEWTDPQLAELDASMEWNGFIQ